MCFSCVIYVKKVEELERQLLGHVCSVTRVDVNSTSMSLGECN